MAWRFPIRIPKTVDELFGWLRELLPQLEIKVLKDRKIETTETAIAHGLGSVPIYVRTSNPHCIAVIRETRRPDKKCVYLRATNQVVADVRVAAVGQIGESLIKNGGYELPDWDPNADDDIHYDIPISIPVLLRNGLIPRLCMVRALTFPANLTGSYARIHTAPTGDGTVNIKKNGTTVVATAALTAASTTVTLASDGFTVAAGDWISIEPPTTDDTAADLSITLKGERL